MGDTQPELAQRRTLIQLARQAAFLIAGWIALFKVLPLSLSSADVSVVLCTFALAELFAAVFATGITGQKMLERLFLNWIGLCGLLPGFLYFGLLPAFQNDPMAVICLLGMALTLGMIRFCLTASHPRALTRLLADSRLILVAFGLYFMKQNGAFSVELLLMGSTLILVSILAAALRLQYAATPTARIKPKDQDVAQICARHADLMILPFILPPKLMLPYLVAKGVSLLLPVFINVFQKLAASPLRLAIAGRQQALFVASAARINLGLMLIAGGLAVAVLSAAPVLSNTAVLDYGQFREILLWLLLAESAPAIFGATAMLMRTSGFGAVHIILNAIAAVVLIVVSVGFVTTDPVLIAKTYAGVHFSIAAISAVILIRQMGIWPGPTALMFRKIKLI